MALAVTEKQRDPSLYAAAGFNHRALEMCEEPTVPGLTQEWVEDTLDLGQRSGPFLRSTDPPHISAPSLLSAFQVRKVLEPTWPVEV